MWSDFVLFWLVLFAFAVGISLIFVFGVLFDRWRSRRAAA